MTSTSTAESIRASRGNTRGKFSRSLYVGRSTSEVADMVHLAKPVTRRAVCALYVLLPRRSLKVTDFFFEIDKKKFFQFFRSISVFGGEVYSWRESPSANTPVGGLTVNSKSDIPPSSTVDWNRLHQQLHTRCGRRAFKLLAELGVAGFDVDDVVQETVRLLLLRGEGFASISPGRQFAHARVLFGEQLSNRIRGEVRRWRREDERKLASSWDAESERYAALEPLIRKEEFDVVCKEINKLNSVHRRVLKLIYFHRLRPAQVGERLNLSARVIRKRQGEALRSLRRQLNRLFPGESI